MFHDNLLKNVAICRTPTSLTVTLEMLDYQTENPVTVVFDSIDWVSANLIGLIANEDCVDYIQECPWDDVPALYACNPHGRKNYLIGLTGGSTVRIVSLPMIVK